MSNVYKDQARDLANIPILRRDVIACVHLEDKEDIVFWDAMLQNRRQGKYHYVTHSKSQNGKETSGSSQCLKFRPYLSKQFFICIDSDMRYLLQEPENDAAHFVCQTYTYSWENHYCEAKDLQKRFVEICPDKAGQFDFEAESNYFHSLNVNEQNAYLHIRGHNLFDLVAYIGDLLCNRPSGSFKKDVLMNDLPPQTYWQIKKVVFDVSTII